MTRLTGTWRHATFALLVILAALPAQLGANRETGRRTSPPPPPTAAPRNLTADTHDSHVVLDWRPVDGAAAYQVFRAVAGVWNPAPVATVMPSRYWTRGLTAGIAYEFKVMAINRGGAGPASEAVKVLLLAPPQGVTATGGSGQVTLAWLPSTGATGYDVLRSVAMEEHTFSVVAANVSGLTFVDTGVHNGTKYFYRIRAVAGGVHSRLSSRVLAKPAAPPTPAPTSAPANLVSSLTGGLASLTWSPVATATSYDVFRTTTGIFGTAPLASVTTPTFSEPGPAAGVTYTYKVAGRNAGGIGPSSAETSVTPTPPPAAPTGISSTAGNGQISLTWTAVAGATAYNVYRGTTAGGQAAMPVGSGVVSSPFVDAGLTNGTAYFYKVTAVGPGGESPRSTETSATPQPPAPSPNSATVSAFRLLRQGTWGPKPGDVDRLVSGGIDGFFAEQLAAAPSVFPDTLYEMSLESSQEHFMSLALGGPDQLRQRVAWALHKIWVVSGVELNNPRAILPYYRLLLNGAFGSYRDLMKAVTLNPAMGRYLNMVNNRGEAFNSNIPANENYARELMQLFTLGLTKLNPGGTTRLDPVTNQPEPAYTEADVKALARILTGWTYGDGSTATVPTGRASENFLFPMEAIAPAKNYHDVTQKTFLGEDFPAGVAAEPELDHALDVIFSHANVAPFVARQLIQQLVTSNPSPGYVADVAAVFDGSHGSLEAVVRAILTHDEAIEPTATFSSGKLAEPVLFVVSQLRALNATVTDHPFMSDKVAEMGQNVFFPGSVFSYFSPGYKVRNTGTPPLTGPEFQSLTTVTALVRANFVGRLIGGGFGAAVTIDYTPFTSHAANAADLVDYTGLLFTGGRLSPEARSEIIAAVGASGTGAQERVSTALYLTLVPATSQVDR